MNVYAAWPEPKPVPDELSPVASLDEALLPEALRPWLADVAERTQVPLEYLAATAVVEASSLIGRRIAIRPKRLDDWTVIPNLWGGIVGRPGVIKSPAMSQALAPIRSLQKVAFERYEDELCEWDDLDDEEKNGANKPVCERFLVNDPTVEKLGELLRENENGLLLFRDELAGFFALLLKKGREGDRQFFLEAWSGNESFIHDRIGRGTVYIPSVCLSIFGSITPGALAKHLQEAAKGGDSDDGMLQRFQLLVYPDLSPWCHIERKPDREAYSRAEKFMKCLTEFSGGSLKNAEQTSHGMRALRFAPEAQEIFSSWLGDLEARVRSRNESAALISHVSKYRSLVPSLALIFHLSSVLEQGIQGPIANEPLNMAIEWAKRLESHARRVYDSLAGGKEDFQTTQILLKKLQEKKLHDFFTARDVYTNDWSGLAETDKVNMALDVLVHLGWLRSTEIRTKGRPTVQYRIYPKLNPPKKRA